MDMKDWVDIALDIKNNYDQFDSFIILHGTDTMCYTASALSFMFQNLDKTVILTGSQVSSTTYTSQRPQSHSLSTAGFNRSKWP